MAHSFLIAEGYGMDFRTSRSTAHSSSIAEGQGIEFHIFEVHGSEFFDCTQDFPRFEPYLVDGPESISFGYPELAFA